MMTHDSLKSPSVKNQVIELMRFIAAMCIVLVHTPGLGIGHFGVDLFFVISGYVMMLSTEVSARHFFLKRCIRILPTYYLCTLLVFVIALLSPSLLNSTTADFSHLFKSLLFIPFDKNGTGHFPVLFLGWTLNYEMYFYALFGLSLLASHRYRGLICSCLLLVGLFVFSNADSLPLAAYKDAVIVEFSLGILVYFLFHKRELLQALGVALFIALGLLISDATLSHRAISAGAPAALVLLISMQASKQFRLPAFVATLGAASYALYLTHPYVIQFFSKMTGWFERGPFFASAATAGAIVLANLVAIAFYRGLEVPAKKFLSDRLIPPRT